MTTSRHERFREWLNTWVDHPVVKLIGIFAAIVAAAASVLALVREWLWRPVHATFLSPDRLDLEVHAFSLLQATDDLEQVARLGIAVRTEHAHQALG